MAMAGIGDNPEVIFFAKTISRMAKGSCYGGKRKGLCLRCIHGWLSGGFQTDESVRVKSEIFFTAVPRESSRLHELEEPSERPAWLVVSFA